MARSYSYSVQEPLLEKRGDAGKKLTSLGVRPMGELSQDSYTAFEPASAPRGFKNERSDPKSLINAELNFRRDAKAENIAVYDGKGEPLVAKSDGSIDSVELTSTDIVKIRALKGEAIVTHNHPKNRSFSANDLFLMVGVNAKEMRAVSDRFVYSLLDPKGSFRAKAIDYKSGRHKKGYLPNDFANMLNSIESNLSQSESLAIAETARREAVSRGTDYDYEYQIVASHIINEKLFKQLGLEYRRIPITNT